MPKIVIICVSVLCLLLILVMVILTVTCRHPPSLPRLSPSPPQLRKAEEYLQISPRLHLESQPKTHPDLLYPSLQHNHRGHHQHRHQAGFNTTELSQIIQSLSSKLEMAIRFMIRSFLCISIMFSLSCVLT